MAGESFCIRAVSGGGRGCTSGKEERTFGSFSPHRATDKGAGIRGGVIPPGLWQVDLPSNYDGKMKKPAAKLIPRGHQVSDYSTREYTNTPFLIHGRGENGSDGCIVIEKEERVRLLGAIERSGGAMILVTVETRESDLLQKNLQLRATV